MTVAQRPNVAWRDYTQEPREKILEDTNKIGVCEAAHQPGVPQPTITGWPAVQIVAPGDRIPNVYVVLRINVARSMVSWRTFARC